MSTTYDAGCPFGLRNNAITCSNDPAVNTSSVNGPGTGYITSRPTGWYHIEETRHGDHHRRWKCNRPT